MALSRKDRLSEKIVSWTLRGDLTVPPTKPPTPGRIAVLNLSRLDHGMPGISPSFGRSMAEAASVCLQQQGHRSGVELVVAGSFQSRFRIEWDRVNEQAMRTWADPEVATEHAACGIAALLIEELTDLTVIERARKGGGFDYWLGPKSSSTPLFQAAARMEVSGIRRGSPAVVRARVRQKVEQTRASDHAVGTMPALVVVVEFSRPLSEVVRR